MHLDGRCFRVVCYQHPRGGPPSHALLRSHPTLRLVTDQFMARAQTGRIATWMSQSFLPVRRQPARGALQMLHQQLKQIFILVGDRLSWLGLSALLGQRLRRTKLCGRKPQSHLACYRRLRACHEIPCDGFYIAARGLNLVPDCRCRILVVRSTKFDDCRLHICGRVSGSSSPYCHSAMSPA